MEPADTEFLTRFEECTLPECAWTHTAHIRVAWICLNLASPDRALERIRTGILQYNTEVLHRRHKYHETVTVAFTRLVAERMRDDERWVEFEMRIDDILDAEEPALFRYYSKDRLFSDDARAKFVEADLRKLPSFDGN